MQEKSKKPQSSQKVRSPADARGPESVNLRDLVKEEGKMLPQISDSALLKGKKDDDMRSQSHLAPSVSSDVWKKEGQKEYKQIAGGREWRSLFSKNKADPSRSKLEPTQAGSQVGDTSRSKLNEKLAQRLTDLDLKRKEIAVLPPLNLYLPDLDEKDFKKLERKAKRIYNRKFEEYKLVFTRAARKNMSADQLQNIEMDESLLKSQFDEARHRNLISKPIPIKRGSKDHGLPPTDDDILFNQVRGLVQNKQLIEEYLSKVDNLKYSQIPEICSIQYSSAYFSHYLRGSSQKDDLIAYLTTNIKEFGRYLKPDLIEMSNLFETKRYSEGDIIQVLDAPIANAFMVYSGVLEEFKGRGNSILLEKGHFHRIGLLEEKNTNSESLIKTKSKEAVLLVISLPRLFETYEVYL